MKENGYYSYNSDENPSEIEFPVQYNVTQQINSTPPLPSFPLNINEDADSDQQDENPPIFISPRSKEI